MQRKWYRGVNYVWWTTIGPVSRGTMCMSKIKIEYKKVKLEICAVRRILTVFVLLNKPRHYLSWEAQLYSIWVYAQALGITEVKRSDIATGDVRMMSNFEWNISWYLKYLISNIKLTSHAMHFLFKLWLSKNMDCKTVSARHVTHNQIIIRRGRKQKRKATSDCINITFYSQWMHSCHVFHDLFPNKAIIYSSEVCCVAAVLRQNTKTNDRDVCRTSWGSLAFLSFGLSSLWCPRKAC